MGFPQAFDVGISYRHELYVDAAAPPDGSGSQDAPFQTIAVALASAQPGTRVHVAAGIYGAVGSIANLQGTAEAPIALVGDGDAVIETNRTSQALHLTDPRYVVIEGITIRGTWPHGINIDDGGSYESPASHVVLRRISFRDIGTGGNNDCLKMSGVDYFHIEGSSFSGCNQGEAIDMVGCHHGVVTGNNFADMPGTAVQTKGGSADVLIHGNRFRNIAQRAINAGGSTGKPYFRPIDAPYEARRIQMIANIIEGGGDTPVAFVGCDTCVFANNTIVDPGRYLARILEENGTRTPGANGFFINNMVLLRSSGRSRYVDVGPGTRPTTYTFGWNLWYSPEEASFAGPEYFGGLPAERDSLIQTDPRLDGDWRPLAGSPAVAAGRDVPRGLAGDFDRVGYGNPPAIGAFAGR